MMKKVTMLVFILTLCITGIASAVEPPACFVICYPGTEPGETVTLIALDESGEQIDMSEYSLVEVNFEGSEADPTGFNTTLDVFYDAVIVDGTLQFTMIEAFYNHNRWVIGVEGDGIDGHLGYWLVVPESLHPDAPEGCTDCDNEFNLNWPPEHFFVVDVIAAGSTCGIDPDCPVPTIVVGGGEVAEEDETSVELTIQLDRNPVAPVTITITEPVWEVDPNLSDPETYTIADAVEGVATVTIPADSNSVTFTVTAIDDSVIEGNLGYLLAVESFMDPNVAGYDPNLVTGEAAFLVGGSVTVIDNDVRTILVDPDFVGLSESDPNVWVCDVNVILSHEPLPLAVVNVAVAMEGLAWDVGMVETDADLEDPNYLQFDETNWNIGKKICFKAMYVEGRANEDEALAFVPADCILTPSSDDPGYDPETGIEPGAVIGLEVEDIDCGSYGFDDRDYNEDCFVNLADFAIFAQGWFSCNDPGNIDCAEVEEE